MPRKKKTRKLARIGHLAIFLVAVSLTLLFYYGAFVFNWHGARAATYNYVVDSTDTQPDDNVGNGICHTAAGTCTLNAAVAEANADAGTTAITFSATGTITLNMAEVVTEPLTITGPGVASLTIAGGGLNPGIRFENSSTGSSISGITLTNTGTNACLSLAVSNLTVNAMAIACKTLLDGDNVTISNNAFTTINGYIVVPGANFNSPYTNLSFTGNSFNATAGSPDGGSYPIGGLTASLNDGITINNNTFTNFSANSIISVSGSNLTVTNNTVTSDGTGFSAAMFDLAPAGGTNTITGNTLTTAGGTKFRDGISISPSVASLTALNVSSNVISNNSRYGIIIEPSSGDLVLISATINSNNVTSNTQQGIYLNSLDAGSSVTFGSNISSTNGENGIYVGGGGGSLTFTGNTLNSSTADNGLDLQDYNGAVVATGNTMNNNGSSGFNLKNTTISSLTFSGNTITGNALGGVAVDGGASTLTLSDSNISSNVTADLALISGVGNTINADNTSFSTYLVMAGLLDANFKVRVRTMDHLGAAASSSTVTATDTASAATAMGTTGGTGYTSYYSLDAYQVNSTGVINQKNPYTFSATHATEGSASSAATTVGTQNQTVTINLPGENLTLTAPNGGEELTGTGTSAVTWTSVGTITNVKLEYSTDNFATATTIIDSTADDGSYDWLIPSDTTTTGKVRVSKVGSPTTNDVSNANFTIISSGPPKTSYQCSDGTDNDGDFYTDYPADPGCSNTKDNSEAPNPACSDGVDNDGDGVTDYPADPGCASIHDNDETDPPACFAEDFTDNPLSATKWGASGHLTDPYSYATSNGQYLIDLVGVGNYISYRALYDAWQAADKLDKTSADTLAKKLVTENFVTTNNKYLFLMPVYDRIAVNVFNKKSYRYVLDDFKAEIKFSGLVQSGVNKIGHGLFRFIVSCRDNYINHRIELNRASDGGTWGGTWATVLGYRPPEIGEAKYDGLLHSSSGTFRIERTGNSVLFFVDGQKFHQMDFNYLPRACVVHFAPEVQLEGSNLEIAIDDFKIFSGCYNASCGDGIVEKDAGEECDLGDQNGVTNSGCSSVCKVVPSPGICNDGKDNDSDGSCDWKGCTIDGKDSPADFSCQGDKNGTDEYNPKPACSDGIDNDGDGYTDYDGGADASRDPGCSSYIDDDESNTGGDNFCGDLVVNLELGEVCDLGEQNGVSGSGCDKDCQPEVATVCFFDDFSSNPMDLTKWWPSIIHISTDPPYYKNTTNGRYVWDLIGVGDRKVYDDLWAIWVKSGDPKDKLAADTYARTESAKWISWIPILPGSNQYVHGDFKAEVKFFDYYSYGDFPYTSGGFSLITDCKDNNIKYRVDFQRYRKRVQAGFNGFTPETPLGKWGAESTGPNSGILRVERQGNSLLFYLSGVKFHQMDFAYLPSLCGVSISASTAWTGTNLHVAADDFKIFNGCYTSVCGDGILNSFGTPPIEECDLGAQNGAAGSGCSTACKGVAKPGQCSNGIDDDSDGTCDYNGCTILLNGKSVTLPADFSCTSATDDDEFNLKPQCSDRIDNDGDLYIDFDGGDKGDLYRDPGCSSFVDDSEIGGSGNVCGDGILNQPEETCDDGPSNSDTTPDACRTNCFPAHCGDGIVDAGSGEACDLGWSKNGVSGSGCTATCKNQGPACFIENFTPNPLLTAKWNIGGHTATANFVYKMSSPATFATVNGRYLWDMIGEGDPVERARLSAKWTQTKALADYTAYVNYSELYNKWLTITPKVTSSTYPYLYLSGDFAAEVKYEDYYSSGDRPYAAGGFHLTVGCKDNNIVVSNGGLQRYGKTLSAYAGNGISGSCYGVTYAAPNSATFRVERHGDSLLYFVDGKKFCQVDYAHLPAVCQVNSYQNAGFGANNRVYADDFKVEYGCYTNVCGDGVVNTFLNPLINNIVPRPKIEECDLGALNGFPGSGCSTACKTATGPGVCSDGIDNDGDGTCDWNGCTVTINGQSEWLPADFSCQKNKDATDEANPKPECSDGIDNDGNGLVDFDGWDQGAAYRDSGCSSFVDESEKGGSLSWCGDGMIDFYLGETCDDGQNNSNTKADGCRTDCVPAYCGDKVKDTEEECDDGNKKDGDGCSITCKIEPKRDTCGNSEVGEGETCDDGNTEDGDGCSATCQIESTAPACSDGIDNDSDKLIDLEDPGCANAEDDDEFNPGEPACGNGVLEQGETCDDNNTVSGDGCSDSCQTEGQRKEPAVCGNGVVEDGEDCDLGDQNGAEDSGCSTVCLFAGTLINVKPGVLGDLTERLVENNETLRAIFDSPMMQFLQKDFFNNPQVEAVNENVVVPLLLVVAVANTVAALPTLGFLPYLQYIFTEPFRFLFYRRRKYGVIYNSLTKQPVDLAVVRLYNAETNQLTATKVTDSKGRYAFVTEPGQYYLKVQKENFIFPSDVLGERIRDHDYADLYYGAPVVLTSKEDAVNLNVPIDPNMVITPDKKILHANRLKKLRKVLAYFGPLLAFVSWIVSPTMVITAILIGHVVLFTLFRRLAGHWRPKSFGVIFDQKTKSAVKNAIVRLFDVEYNKLLATQVANSAGKYSFLVGPNNYYLTVASEGYQTYKSGPLDFSKGKEAVVDKDVGLKKV